MDILNHLPILWSAAVIAGTGALAVVCDFLRSHNEHLREENAELRVRCEQEQFHHRIVPPAQPGTALPKMRRGARTSEPAAEARSCESLTEARAVARELLEPRGGKPVPDTTVAAPPRLRDWSELLNKHKRTTTPQVADRPAPMHRRAELIPFETISQPVDLPIPQGFQEGMILTRILNGEKIVRGLVVVIGLNDLAARRDNGGELGAEALTASVAEHVRSMLEPGDFACQSSSDEFLLVCPGERGAAAQRRLSVIAEKLWDFQLRSVGASTILFSWGGVEALGDPFADAFSAAADRMRETRRSRRLLSMERRSPATLTHRQSAAR